MLLQSLVKLIATSCCGLQATAPEKDALVVRKVSLEDLAAVVELLAVSAAWSLPDLEASMCIAVLSARLRQHQKQIDSTCVPALIVGEVCMVFGFS